MRIARLYQDENGESHFGDFEMRLEMTDYALPAPPLYFSKALSANSLTFMQARAGWRSDWHPSQARNLFIVVTGDWEVTAGDGETRRFGAAACCWSRTRLAVDTGRR